MTLREARGSAQALKTFVQEDERMCPYLQAIESMVREVESMTVCTGQIGDRGRAGLTYGSKSLCSSLTFASTRPGPAGAARNPGGRPTAGRPGRSP